MLLASGLCEVFLLLGGWQYFLTVRKWWDLTAAIYFGVDTGVDTLQLCVNYGSDGPSVQSQLSSSNLLGWLAVVRPGLV